MTGLTDPGGLVDDPCMMTSPVSVDEMRAGLRRHVRVDLGLVQTPLHPLRGLGRHLGINLLVKRDDCLPLAMGGNKARQLEFYLGPARKAGTDTVLITGAIQSNFVRLCIAAASVLGMRAVVQLEKRVPKDSPIYNQSGNVLLDKLLGAEIHYFDGGDDEAAADAQLDRLADELRAKGRKPYVIHLGLTHPPLGALGYCEAAAETYVQMEEAGHEIGHVVVPSGSGLTHGGFLCGANAIGWDVPIHGVCVRRSAIQQKLRLGQRVAEIDGLLRPPHQTPDARILLNDSDLAPGYGQLNPKVRDAISLAARLDGLLLDPVYSGRAMAGLISLVNAGVVEHGQTVLFVHTGGQPALFAYEQELAGQ